ncbi:hypothetical protein K438DRAFT_2019798 [Mycena galopus ATCC 62051]|nr:hypothetical protein K438DRAFT_2019798 [Mycena galopus ATCC 62051]
MLDLLGVVPVPHVPLADADNFTIAAPSPSSFSIATLKDAAASWRTEGSTIKASMLDLLGVVPAPHAPPVDADNFPITRGRVPSHPDDPARGVLGTRALLPRATPPIGSDKSGVERTPTCAQSQFRASHPLAVDAHTDSRSLAHHAAVVGQPWTLHRLRVLSSALLERGGKGKRWLSDPGGMGPPQSDPCAPAHPPPHPAARDDDGAADERGTDCGVAEGVFLFYQLFGGVFFGRETLLLHDSSIDWHVSRALAICSIRPFYDDDSFRASSSKLLMLVRFGWGT